MLLQSEGPDILWSDEDPAIPSTIENTYRNGSVKHLLCDWHISNCVTKKLLLNKVGHHLHSIENAFHKVQYSESEVQFNIELANLLEIVKPYPLLVDYFTDMVKIKNKWCHVFRVGLKHLGLQSTQRAESINAIISKHCNKSTNVTNLINTISSYVISTESKSNNGQGEHVHLLNELAKGSCLNFDEIIDYLHANFSNFAYYSLSTELSQFYLYQALLQKDDENFLYFNVTFRPEHANQLSTQDKRSHDIIVNKQTGFSSCQNCRYCTTRGFMCRHYWAAVIASTNNAIPFHWKLIDARWKDVSSLSQTNSQAVYLRQDCPQIPFMSTEFNKASAPAPSNGTTADDCLIHSLDSVIQTLPSERLRKHAYANIREEFCTNLSKMLDTNSMVHIENVYRFAAVVMQDAKELLETNKIRRLETVETEILINPSRRRKGKPKGRNVKN